MFSHWYGSGSWLALTGLETDSTVERDQTLDSDFCNLPTLNASSKTGPVCHFSFKKGMVSHLEMAQPSVEE
jgi:hypothetical protein